jgi:bidirectional [NiFe] hydrogenase diaphorase subunit
MVDLKMATLARTTEPRTLPPPSDDKRWRIVSATMRRHGFAPSALIETLHAAQEAFGFLDDSTLKFVARSLGIPLSKVYGVVTFYSLFRMKPEGEHTCVVCMGTACYIKGASKLISAIEETTGCKPGETTEDKKVSILVARCLGACGIAPAVILDGDVQGNITPAAAQARIEEWMRNDH